MKTVGSVGFVLLFLFPVLRAHGQFIKSSDSTKKKKPYFVIPVVLRSIETGWSLGAGGSYFFRSKRADSLVRTSNIEVIAFATERSQFVGGIQLNLYSSDEKWILHWKNSYTNYYDNFWGLGNNSQEINKEKYYFNQIFFNPQLTRRLKSDWYVGFAYELQHVYRLDYLPGGLFEKESITGRNGGTVSGAGFIVSWDSRDHAFYCTRGSYFQLMVLDFDSVLGSDFDYVNYVVDLRKFFSLSKREVVGLQSYSYLNSGNVAIRNMAILGGSDIMRGYFEGRYTDKNLTAIQGEYRYQVLDWFGLVGFIGFGEVFSDVSQLSFEQLKYSIGNGVRFALDRKEKLNLRIDYGFGDNSSGLYFTVRESF